LEDLIKESKLVNKDYGIIHFDSPDKRGIDVYTVSKEIFPTYSNIPLIVYIERQKSVNENENSDRTDDNLEETDQNNRVFTGTNS
jgi:hypothetical protein